MDKKREQKEQEAIEELFPIFYKKIAYIRSKIEKIYEIRNRKDIFNAAILLNNKVVEIGQIFKTKDIGFYSESSLKSIILSKLIMYYEQACSELKTAEKINEDIEDDSIEDDYGYIMRDFVQTINNYKEHCNEIYSYSLENNIVKDIIERYNSYKDKNIANENLEKYKKELILLGYRQLVEDLTSKLASNSLEEIDSER